MKKISGIVLLVIAGLNIVAIVVKSVNGEPAGSPGYIIVILLMVLGGIHLVESVSKENKEDTEA